MDEPEFPTHEPKLDTGNAFVVTIDRHKRNVSMLFYEPIWGLQFTHDGMEKLIDTLRAYASVLKSIESGKTN